MKYTTIIDIAQALGISKSTVSRALRGDKQNVSKETRERILAMAKKMGYTRNELAVNLRKQSTRTIGNADSFLYEFHYLCPTGIE